ncbi:hypothetical protein DOTSEDRAFT_82981 [Dothistroma septosporum NZE10]|uniref:Uncharacterized protein n=1 Tax=Dothistroma septosporum (strain NZE10 / CBS 128990) TaxID=675120 RepID=M2YJK3_DOTSN|nr:hypothetical protein DOTSEDRAFT_82981 [Dothistroma septosporum NZE10]
MSGAAMTVVSLCSSVTVTTVSRDVVRERSSHLKTGIPAYPLSHVSRMPSIDIQVSRHPSPAVTFSARRSQLPENAGDCLGKDEEKARRNHELLSRGEKDFLLSFVLVEQWFLKTQDTDCSRLRYLLRALHASRQQHQRLTYSTDIYTTATMAQPPRRTSDVAATKDAPPTATRSHGRGGAGNINSKAPLSVNAEDLKTPTIKSVTYTTGRGGSGNMAKNDPTNPDETRLAQDVNTPDHHSRDMNGTYHWGRGGEGNMTTVGKSGADQARAKSQERRKARALSGSKEVRPEVPRARTGSFKGAMEKGKEFLGLKKNGAAKEDESAVRSQSIQEDESAISD